VGIGPATPGPGVVGMAPIITAFTAGAYAGALAWPAGQCPWAVAVAPPAAKLRYTCVMKKAVAATRR
jgi:hypothetical protein